MVTFFREGDELRLVVQGKYFISGVKVNQPFSYKKSTQGKCRVHSSTKYRSELLMPIIGKLRFPLCSKRREVKNRSTKPSNGSNRRFGLPKVRAVEPVIPLIKAEVQNPAREHQDILA